MAMNQEKPNKEGQFEYLGRWVDKKHFRAFVYNDIEQKLANSYEEYNKLVSSGLWFASKKIAISTKINLEIVEKMQKCDEKHENVEDKDQVQLKNDKKSLKFNRSR